MMGKKCEKCGVLLDTEKIGHLSVMTICHNCGHTYHLDTYFRYAFDQIYGNGQKVHVAGIVPYKCEKCGVEIRGHEFYCGVSESSQEILETVATESHPRLKQKMGF